MLSVFEAFSIISLAISVAIALIFLIKIRPIANIAKQGEIALKRGMSAMGEVGNQYKLVKQGEKLVMGDIMSQFPEVKFILERFSPDTLEFIEQNPEAFITLMSRYAPLIEQITGKSGLKQSENTDYHF